MDVGLIPRGGHRRRKSMEPRALANLNGTLVPSTSTTPARSSSAPSSTRDYRDIPDTPLTSKAHRRDSVQWIRSPSSSSPNEDAGQIDDDQTFILSPVPATPAPEFISSYGKETPGAQTPYFLHKEQLVQKTAPQGKRLFDAVDSDSSGFLSEKKDESVMMRLMAARRKSLQWAPKVGSPLAKGEMW